MRAACMDCPRAEAPYAEAEAAFAQATASLSSRDAQHMSESDLERELHRRGQELMRTLLQGHLEQRSPGEAAGPVEGADGVARSERRVHARHLETIFGTVQVERLGYARRGDVHLVSLDPTTGSEIRKTRPCLVISLTSPAPTLISPGRLSHRLLAQGAGRTPRSCTHTAPGSVPRPWSYVSMGCRQRPTPWADSRSSRGPLYPVVQSIV